jgi:serine protease SohB
MDFWLHIASFALKAALVVGALGGLVILIVSVARGEQEDEIGLKINSLNHRYDEMEERFVERVLDKKALKARRKAHKKEAKQDRADTRKCIYVLDFKGAVKASTAEQLAQQIDGVLTIAKPESDEIVVKVNSPGGLVTSYGYAASQLLRIRDAKIPLTVCVDEVAASGGYLMACTANKILCAPFAVVGSIGVVAEVPNLHRLLKKNDIDYEQYTAGEYKRTVSVLGEITEEGREHFKEKLGATHVAFKDFVKIYRPQIELEKVANGDHWYGQEALSLGLIDALSTSDDYLFRARQDARIFKVAMEEKQTLIQQLMKSVGFAAENVLESLLNMTRRNGM